MLAVADPEARYLELASRPGNETLRQACLGPLGFGCCILLYPDLSGITCVCEGRQWLPLPEAERLGALVRATATTGLAHYSTPKTWGSGKGMTWGASIAIRENGGLHFGGDEMTPEAALVEALLLAQNV